jgi:hypothetical protein
LSIRVQQECVEEIILGKKNPGMKMQHSHWPAMSIRQSLLLLPEQLGTTL